MAVSTDNEIIEHVRSMHTEFGEDALGEYITELKEAQQVIENNQEIISNYRYYLTPTMYMAILKNSKKPDSEFSKMP